jgi:class 3 adenylate cyclase/pimeloyl-ACP methyl ester carboxylesterase
MDMSTVRYAWREGRAIAYQRWGAGASDLLILQEWPGNADAVWEHPYQLRISRLWGSVARCIRFDRSGIGSSDPMPGGTIAGPSEWAEDAIAVLDAVGVETAVVGGEGWASHAAMALAVSHPERVERLILYNAFARLLAAPDWPDGLPERNLDGVVELVRSAWGTGAVIGGGAPHLTDRDPDFPARFERTAASPGVAAAMTRAMRVSDARAYLGQIRCPTLVIYTGDIPFIPERASRYLATAIPGAELISLRSEGFYKLGTEASQRLVEFVTGEPGGDLADRELAVVAFTDIVGSTAQLAKQGDREWINTLADLDIVVTRQAARFGGRVVKHTGDGHLLRFASPGAALSALLAIRNAGSVVGVSLRSGAHMGEVEVRDDGDIAGITVHGACRIAEQAAPEQILVSRVVADLLAGTGLELLDAGSRTMKGLPGEWPLFSVNPLSASFLWHGGEGAR